MRGHVKLAGSSDVLTLSPGAALKITVQHHNEQGTEEVESHQAVWDGERIAIDYEFDPQHFLEEVQRRQRASPDEAKAQEDVELHGRVEVTIKVYDRAQVSPFREEMMIQGSDGRSGVLQIQD